MRKYLIIAALSLTGLWAATQLFVLGNRVFAVTTTGAGGAGGSTGGSTGTGGATGGTGGSGTGGAAGAGGSAGSGGGTGGAAGAAGSGTGGGTGGATGGTGGALGCGDGTRQDGEFCDGSDLQGSTCTALGFSGGSLACSTSCQFDVSSCTGGTITPTVVASTTSCTTPCGVFFDTITTSGLSGGDYVGATWNWDFNDPTSAHPASVGSGVGHVYDNPGTYVATVRVRDLAGASGKATKTITVTAPSYTTFYVANSGSDSNNGLSMSTPFLTAAHGFAAIGASNALLFRRGDTFALSGTPTVTGPAIVSAYTDPGHVSAVAPILSTGASGSVTLTGTHPVFTNIHIVSTGSGNGLQMIAATNAVAEYNEIEGTGSGCCGSTSGLVFYGDTGPTVNDFIFDNNAHDFAGYGYYGATDHLAIVGNQFVRIEGGDHGVRVIHGNLTYVAENNIVGNAGVSGDHSPFSGITIRGDQTNIVVWHNRSNRLIELTPQNDTVLEHVQLGLVEANISAEDRTTDFYFYAMNITAQNVVVRNNILAGCPVGINVQGMPLLPANYVTGIVVSNNTDYFFGTTYDPTFGSSLVSASDTTGTVAVRNNIFAEGQTDNDSQIAFISTPGGVVVTEDHNLLYAPSAIGTPSPGSGTGDIIGNPHFVSTTLSLPYPLEIGSASAARNAGTSVPVYQDRASVTRPKESVSDIGQSEYAP